MALYVKYQCSVCRRFKSVIKDTVRANPNYCTITKGCSGRLFIVGETKDLESTVSIPGLEDWYPRGQQRIKTDDLVEELDVYLHNSGAGTLVMGLFLTPAEKATMPYEFYANFDQRKTEDIKYLQYIFQSSSGQTIFQGRDINGVNMRFDQGAINENRVFVRVDGVAKFNGTDLILDIDKITFNVPISLGSVINVSVYQEKQTTRKLITFLDNSSSSVEVSAWSNVLYCEKGDLNPLDDTRKRWFLFSASGSQLRAFTSGTRLRFNNILDFPSVSLDNIKFFLSKSPYAHVDRYKTYYVSANILSSNFLTRVETISNTKVLVADSSALEEVFPPLKTLFEPATAPSVLSSSFIDTSKEYATDESSSAIVSDDNNDSVLLSKKILGPI